MERRLTDQKQSYWTSRSQEQASCRYIVRKGVYLKTIGYRRPDCHFDNSHGQRLEYLHLEIEDAVDRTQGTWYNIDNL